MKRGAARSNENNGSAQMQRIKSESTYLFAERKGKIIFQILLISHRYKREWDFLVEAKQKKIPNMLNY